MRNFGKFWYFANLEFFKSAKLEFLKSTEFLVAKNFCKFGQKFLAKCLELSKILRTFGPQLR